MLSLSLRRKSAPGSTDVRDGTPSPRRAGTTTSSLSSRKGFASFLGFGHGDGILSEPETYDKVAERAHTPIYDPDNPQHNPEISASVVDSNMIPRSLRPRKESRQPSVSPSRCSSTRTRSLSQSRTSPSPKTFLDTLASKMKAATEFFHKSTTTSVGKESTRLVHAGESPSRSVSPKKSVRFRSHTSEIEDETTSSPIKIPNQNAPRLPSINLPDELRASKIGGLPIDLVMTARPPATPILKATEKRFGVPYALQMTAPLNLQQVLPDKMSAMPGTNLHMENPFDDAAALTETENNALKDSDEATQHVRLIPHVFRATGAMNAMFDDELTATSVEYGVGSVGNASSEGAGYISDKRKSVHANPFLSSSDNKPPMTTASGASGPPPLKTNLGIKASSLVTRLDPETRQSQWTLESRQLKANLEDQNSSDTNDADSEGSDTPGTTDLIRTTADVHSTHEDIRKKFRPKLDSTTSVSQTTPDPSSLLIPASETYEANGGATAANDECAFVDGHFHCNERGRELEDNTSACSAELETDSATDPQKQIRGRARSLTGNVIPAKSKIIPDEFVSPLNLKATVSSVSPSRSRRPFRFSNRTDEVLNAIAIRNTSFSWHARKAAQETLDTLLASSETRTPSPVAIPLPLSVATTKRRFLPPRPETQYRDQYGWSPSDESHFPHAVVAAKYFCDDDLIELLTKKGGFAQFWKEAGLPKETAPYEDTEKLSAGEAEVLIRWSRETSRTMHGSHLIEQFKTNLAAAFLKRPEVSGNTLSPFAPLVTHRQEYSGELSTNDGSSVMSIEKPSCFESDCRICHSVNPSDSTTASSDFDTNSRKLSQGVADQAEHEKENILTASAHTPLPGFRQWGRDATERTSQQANLPSPILLPISSRRKCEAGSGGSEASGSVLGTSTDTRHNMEDEHFARGLV